MMLQRQNVKAYLRVLYDLGVNVIDTEPTGKSHYKITVTSRGRKRFFIAPRSASDSRSLKNFKALVRRWQKSLNHQEFT